MNTAITHYACKPCGSNRPVKFELPSDGLVEINVKRFCGYCGIHIDSVYFDKIPHFDESRRLIWGLTKEVDMINRVKVRTGFKEENNGVMKNIQYWNLWSELCKMAAE